MSPNRIAVAAVAALALGAWSIAARAALLENLAYNASGSGTQPSVTLDQGSAAGIFDGSMFDWGSGSATSPRRSYPSRRGDSRRRRDLVVIQR